MSAVFITDCWGEQDSTWKVPLVGSAGCDFARMLAQAGWPADAPAYKFISAASMLPRWRNFPHEILSVFPLRPLGDDIEVLYAHAADADVDRSLPVRKFGSSNKYIRTEYAQHVHDLRAKILDQRPNVVVALGATPTWTLGLGASITKLRGYVYETEFGKVLPTYHPSSVLRKWSNRIVSVVDLHKALRESAFSEIRQVAREIWTEPTIEDLWVWWEMYGSKADRIAVDIETVRRQQISEVGFAASPTQALHIPFVYQAGGQWVSWWKTKEEEVKAWKFVKHVCESETPKLGQNVIQYDAFWLAKEMGISIHNISHDTMQMAHAWSPEMQKSLGFLGSFFLDVASWKQIRKAATEDK